MSGAVPGPRRDPRPWRPDAGGPVAALASLALSPLALVYGAVAGMRMRLARPAPPPRPTIGVGSPVAGGAGKTPTTLALGRAALGMGLTPGFLSRGHGRYDSKWPLMVDPTQHAAEVAGDEPLLLAALGPTMVCADRVAGAGLLAAHCDLIIMDDGFQSRRLRADQWLLVMDGAAGTGNGRVLPAGPLRAPLGVQAARADAALIVESGAGLAGAAGARAAFERAGLPVHVGRVEPVGSWHGWEMAAFCGIADPAKFRRTLEAAGARVRRFRAFPDHHPFTPHDLREIRAMGGDLPLVTTAKDAARLGPDAPPHEVLHIELTLAPGVAEGLIERALAAHEPGAKPSAGVGPSISS